RRVAPGTEIDLSYPVAADVGFGIDEFSERTCVDLSADPPEMALAAPLVSQGEHDPGLAACHGDGAPFGDGIGDRLVEKYVLGRRGGGTRGFQMRVVRRGVDDRLDCAIFQDGLVDRRRPAAVVGGAGPASLFVAGVSGYVF